MFTSRDVQGLYIKKSPMCIFFSDETYKFFYIGKVSIITVSVLFSGVHTLRTENSIDYYFFCTLTFKWYFLIFSFCFLYTFQYLKLIFIMKISRKETNFYINILRIDYFYMKIEFFISIIFVLLYEWILGSIFDFEKGMWHICIISRVCHMRNVFRVHLIKKDASSPAICQMFSYTYECTIQMKLSRNEHRTKFSITKTTK